MKGWFKYLFYISLVFLVVALIRADYLKIPTIYNTGLLILSILLLILGFVFAGLSWSQVVKHGGYKISNRKGIASHGLSIFAKYIPGKFWVIMGRAEYIAKKYDYPRKNMTSLSFDAQFIALWTALLLGTIGIISVNGFSVYGISVAILFLILSLIIYTPIFHRLAETILSRILKRKIDFPKLPFFQVIKMIGWYMISIGLWSVSFYIMASSIVETEVPFKIAFGFALASSIGILAVFAPGGLGVREGILTGFLKLAGIGLIDATTIAVTSRLWYLIGEIAIFLLAYYLHRRK